MSALPELWLAWIAPLSAQVAVLATLVLLLERCVGHRAPGSVRSALVWAVWLRLWLSPGLFSPVSLGALRAASSVGASPTAAAASGVESARAWPTVCLGLWVAGVLVTAFVAARRIARERRELLGAAGPAGDRVRASAERAARRLGLRRVPAVLESRNARGPATIGILRPRLVLPSGYADTQTDARLEHVMLHELGHAARRDGLAAAAWLVARVVFWFHPWVHVVAARAATLREIGADELAAASAGTRAYRGTLSAHARDVLLRASLTPSRLASAGFVPLESAIRARLQALSRPARLSTRASSALGLAVFGLVACCCVPLAPRSLALPPLDELQGCLRKRYAVLAALAAAEAPTGVGDAADSDSH